MGARGHPKSSFPRRLNRALRASSPFFDQVRDEVCVDLDWVFASSEEPKTQFKSNALRPAVTAHKARCKLRP